MNRFLSLSLIDSNISVNTKINQVLDVKSFLTVKRVTLEILLEGASIISTKICIPQHLAGQAAEGLQLVEKHYDKAKDLYGIHEMFS